MMMMKTAGGPGGVSPLDFHERRPSLPRQTWVAIGLVAAAHVGLGVVLYNQRFEIAAPEPTVEPPTTMVTFEVPRPKPEPVKADSKPAAPNAPVHRTPAPTTATETLPAVPAEGPVAPSTTVSLSEPVRDPTPDAAPAVEPTPKPPSVIANPSWVRQPTGQQLMRAYPDRAINAKVSGSASLNCAVRADGNVGDCRVVDETPGGYGFGRAAQDLSRYFRINPRTVNGQAVDGARVNIRLQFRLPE